MDFFLPRVCPSCEANLTSSEEAICNKCLSAIRKISEENITAEYNRKFREEGYVDKMLPYCYFERDKEVQNIIHSIKYKQRFQNGIYFGKKIGEAEAGYFASVKFDLIIPVPLHHLKKAERGYNQSVYIAKGLAKQIGVKVNNKIIKRSRYTKSQTTLSITERKRNMRGAFIINKNKLKEIKGKKIIILDDVITTGVTVAECAKILKRAGAQTVVAVSIALAL